MQMEYSIIIYHLFEYFHFDSCALFVTWKMFSKYSREALRNWGILSINIAIYLLNIFYHQFTIPMKHKKHLNDREIDHITIPSKHRAPSSQVLTKRKEDKSNKQNMIQITEPLETFTSKQFTHSKDHQNRSSRSNLKDISQQRNSMVPQRPTITKKFNEKQQEAFDRRLSLKCTTNFSQQLDSQKSHRLSVAPLRRQSLNTNTLPQSAFIERDSISTFYQNSIVSQQLPRQRSELNKQAIMTNLMNKLEHEQDLRSIIQSKLKSGPSTQYIGKQRKNQSYITDFTQDSTSVMSNKLKQCQSEIKQFKNIIKEMSQKIIELTTDQGFKKKQAHRYQDSNSQADDLMGIFKKIGGFSNCDSCSKRGKKETKEIGIQANTTEPQPLRMQAKMNESFDFLQNLQKTLKVLDGKKH